MNTSSNQEFFNAKLSTSSHPVVAALETAFGCTIAHGLLSDDPSTALEELCYEHRWLKTECVPATYRSVCNTLFAGGAAITRGFELRTNLRDRFGFVEVKCLQGTQFYRGFFDSLARPGLICQRTTELDRPRGNTAITTPSGTRIVLPPGSFFVDADTFDEHMTAQTLLTVMP